MTRDAYREQVVGKLNAAAESAGRKVVRPEDLRPGDRVRIVETTDAVVMRAPEDNGGWFSILTDGGTFLDKSDDPQWTRTWELIERPKPEARLGSVWVDPMGGDDYVALLHGRFAEADGGRVVRPDADPDYGDSGIIARLVPAEGEA